MITKSEKLVKERGEEGRETNVVTCIMEDIPGAAILPIVIEGAMSST
jgi:hypothetical protein